MGIKKAEVLKPKKKNQSVAERQDSMNKTKLEIENIKLIGLDLWLKGYTLTYICKELERHGHKCSPGTLSKYVQAFLAEYQQERFKEKDRQVHAELMRLDKLERTYWEAWERSVGMVTSRTVGGWESGLDVAGMKAGVKTIALDEDTNTVVNGHTPKAKATRANKKYVTYNENLSIGDVRYLMGIERVIDKRCKLLGLDAPLVVEDKTKTMVIRKISIGVAKIDEQ